MFDVLKIQISRPFLVLGGIEFSFLVLCFYGGVMISWVEYPNIVGLLEEYWLQAVIFAGIFTASLFAVGLYGGLLTSSFASILVRLGVAFSLGFVALSVIFYVFPEIFTWRSVTAGALVLAFVGIGTIHLIFLKFPDLTALKRRVVVIGTGEKAARIQELVDDARAYGFVCLGFVDTSGEKPSVRPRNILPNSGSLVDLVERLKADEIVVAEEDNRNHSLMDQLVECGFRGVPVIDYLPFWERETKRTDLDALTRNWILIAGGLPGGRLHHLVMRTFDLLLSVATLIFLLPVLVGAALAIKIDSTGPIFYRQGRVGLRGRPIELLKFRSMGVDAEWDGVPQWSARNDPRVTTIGAFIRKSRIDELPQILNVLKGEMKFVGPRPERPFFVERLAKEIPFYMQRFQVKPGITGWAQLNYPYGASNRDAREKLQYDLFYIKNYSLLFDLTIVLQTIRVVLWPQQMTEPGPRG